MKRKLGFLGLLCLYFNARAQNINTIQPLKVGDTLSVSHLQNVLNYKSSEIGLKDFSNKILILDFWATWCENCINFFADNYKLQQKFKGSIQILLVNSKSSRDTRERVRKFFDERKKYYTFPSLVYDTVLTRLFPHQTIPHYVWIINNRIYAITGEGQLNEKNLTAALSGSKWVSEQAAFIPYNYNNELITDGQAENNFTPIYHTIIGAYRKNLQSGIYLDKDSSGAVSRIVLTNFYKRALLKIAYTAISNNDDRTIVNLLHPGDMANDSLDEKWRQQNMFTYESTFSKRSMDEVRRSMQSDLEKYFGLVVTTKDSVVKCYVLKLSDRRNVSNADNSMIRPETNIREHTAAPVYFTNFSIKEILEYLENVYKVPFVDETNIEDRINLKSLSAATDPKKLAMDLKIQGFQLNMEERKITFAVISEINPLKPKL